MPENIAEWNALLLDYLLKIRERNPEFTFYLRKQNKYNKLNKGYWFQGTHNYCFVGFYKRGAGHHYTQSIGFVVKLNKQNEASARIEIVIKDETDEKLLNFYQRCLKAIGGFEQVNDIKFERYFPQDQDIFTSLDEFLNVHKPKIDSLIKEMGLEDEMFISEDEFYKSLKRVLSYRDKKNTQQNSHENPGMIVTNITWNSKDWKSPTEDQSDHRWVKEGNIPHESWNFDFENPRNKGNQILGYCQWKSAPSLEGDNNIVVFYSKNQIVGFYGQASFLKESEEINDVESYNIIARKDLSLVLENKIENIKDKGYLEDKTRVGQVGFNYLQNTATVLSILDEAKKLNPEQSGQINKLINWFKEKTEINNKNTIMSDAMEINQILTGPPGTGKTYHTVDEALKIVDPEFYEENANQREKLHKRFKELLITDWDSSSGRIAFCTFHQSFSYEDFVEGIKPQTLENKDIFYDVEPGIFKKICKLSENNKRSEALKKTKLISWEEDEYNDAIFYKLSLGNSRIEEDKDIYDYCINNNCIAIGFVDKNFSGLSESDIKKECKPLNVGEYAPQAISIFIWYLKKDNYVVISHGNQYIRALGKVVGDYEYNPNTPIHYNHFRDVEWIFFDEEIPVEDFYEKNFTQKTIYKLDSEGIRKDFFVQSTQSTTSSLEQEKEDKYVLIIDEINRGNIASIFGELITLIEKDKRVGGEEELEITLPYSKDPFKVPGNVYLLGTMNTADRSIEALDTALRRRFTFKEIPPQPGIIAEEGLCDEGKVEGIDLVAMLKAINQRIEKLIDKDHMIGHSYFLNVETFDDLKFVFFNKIIPLLQEYFFGDFGKIGLVLGEGFIQQKKQDFQFANFPHYDPDVRADLEERQVFKITSMESWKPQNFISIYQ